MNGELIFVGQEQLKLHPKNIRLYYAPSAVAEMANSLAAVAQHQPTGNIQALLVTPGPSSTNGGGFYVVDGNLRLTAGRSLGEACPLFKCEVIEASQAEQLLLMAVSGLHFPKDTISQGKHFRRLMAEEGFSQKEIADQTGLSTGTIQKCLAALDLDEEIQQLFVEKRLSDDIRIIRALKSLPDPRLGVQVAKYYAGRDTAIGTIVRRIRLLADKAHQVNGNGTGHADTKAQAEDRAQKRRETRAKNKQSARSGLGPEAAKRINAAAVKILCAGCSLAEMSDKCALCPGPMEFMAHLGEMVECSLAEAENVE